jgi:hypothetical protein
MKHRHIAGGLFLASIASAVPALAANILISGFNADVVRENAPGNFAHRFDGAGWNMIESGYFFGRGLPSSGSFMSATGSGVDYQLASYMGLNALSMGYDNPNTGSLTVQPGRYKTLHILAGSGTGGSQPVGLLNQTSDITLNFADGSVVLGGALNAYDWGNGAAGNVAIAGMDRGSSTTLQQYETVPVCATRGFALYETTIDLAALGDSGRTLQSITFANAAVADGGVTNVMAIDGTPVPEPAFAALILIAAPAILRRRNR